MFRQSSPEHKKRKLNEESTGQGEDVSGQSILGLVRNKYNISRQNEFGGSTEGELSGSVGNESGRSVGEESVEDELRGSIKDKPRVSVKDESDGSVEDEPVGSVEDELGGSVQNEPSGSMEDETGRLSEHPEDMSVVAINSLFGGMTRINEDKIQALISKSKGKINFIQANFSQTNIGEQTTHVDKRKKYNFSKAHVNAPINIGASTSSVDQEPIDAATSNTSTQSSHAQHSTKDVDDAITTLHQPLKEMNDVLITNRALEQPTQEECPKLVIMDADLFSIGGHRITEEYKPDRTFETVTYEIEGEEIQLDQLFQPDENGKVPRHVLLTASAGMGKSTLLRRFSKKTANKDEKYPKFKVVLFLEFKLFDTEEKLLLKDFFFVQSPKITDINKELLLQWMVENDGKDCLFVIDGLDQFPANLNADKSPINYFSNQFSSSIVRDLFSQKIFPEARLLTSSREHAIRCLPDNCLPDRFVGLQGLSDESIDKLILQLAGVDGENILHYLKNFSILLYTLCNNPLFLTYVIGVQKRFPNKQIESLTELLLQVIMNLIFSEHARKIRNMAILYNLCQLAFNGTLNRKVMFKMQESDIEELDDLVIVINEENKHILQRVLRGRYLVFFSHQILQELCTALHICMMRLDNFKETIHKMFLENEYEHWSIVIRILAGLILNERVSVLRNEVTGVDTLVNMTEKRNLLREEICANLLENGNTVENEEVVPTLMECNGHFLLNDKISINLVNEDFLNFYNFDAFCLVSVIVASGNVEIFRVRGTAVFTESNVNVMTKYLQHAQRDNLYSDTFECDVSGGPFYFPADMISLLNVKKLTMSDCQVSATGMINFKKTLDKRQVPMKIELMDFSDNVDIECEELWEVVVKANVSKLLLGNCNLSQDSMYRFTQVLDQVGKKLRIESLNFSWNDEVECEELWQVVVKANVINLDLKECNFSEDGMKQFKQVLESFEGPLNLTYLDLSDNCNIECVELWQIFVTANLTVVKLRGCNLSQGGMKDFKQVLDQVEHPVFMESFDISENEDIACEELWHIIPKLNIKNLTLKECNLFQDDMKEFKQVFDQRETSYTLDSLNFSGNRNIECNELWQIIVNTKVKNLTLRYCDLSKDGMKQFKQVLDQTENQINLDMLEISGNSKVGCDELWEAASKLGIKEIKMSRCPITKLQIEKIQMLFQQTHVKPRLTCVSFDDDIEYNEGLWKTILDFKVMEVELNPKQLLHGKMLAFADLLETHQHKMDLFSVNLGTDEWETDGLDDYDAIVEDLIKLMPYMKKLKVIEVEKLSANVFSNINDVKKELQDFELEFTDEMI